jgi:hypothetical protein
MKINQSKFVRVFFLGIFFALLIAQPAFALYPDNLPDGRTYDQASNYIQWNGSVAYISLYHKDQTTIPPEDGGGNCSQGCIEQVTRIYSGSSISGNFINLQGLNVQVATTGDSGSGTAVIRACGQIIASEKLYKSGAKSPGFYNAPSPMWNVPTADACTWSITATGGYVDFRAITASVRPSPAPTLNLQINHTEGPVSFTEPAAYSLNWTGTGATGCTASGDWTGEVPISGERSLSNIPIGTHTYTLTCTSGNQSASDTVIALVYAAPTVDIQVNHVDGPLTLYEPASLLISWTSSGASSCQSAGDLAGSTGTSGTLTLSPVQAGQYLYAIHCINPAGAETQDSVQVIVQKLLPTVDLKVNQEDGPLSILSSTELTLTWTSQNADHCSATGSSTNLFSGNVSINGELDLSILTPGEYTFTISCDNSTGSGSDIVEVTIIETLSGSLDVDTARLVLYASRVGQSGQSIYGTISGGIPPFTGELIVRPPSGSNKAYHRSGDTWSVTPANTGDGDFGTTEQGTWTAWAELRDGFGQIFRTLAVTWEVAWYPVHGLP